MHLNTSQTRALGDVMRLLSEASDGDSLRAALALPMLQLLQADQYTSMVWDDADERFKRFISLNTSPDSIRNWDSYYRFIDPLTFPMMRRQRPTVATQIIQQSELVRGEFFNDFLRPDHMYWGINVYFSAGNQAVGDFRIWRKRERGNFDSHDVEILGMVEPAIAAALGKLHWERSKAPAEAFTRTAEEILRRDAQLSEREAEVAWLVACGCQDKTIATRLKMGHPTVRFHLANAFRKLHAPNRASLASRVQSIVESRKQSTGQIEVM